jgi:UDP-3-O-acyl-N-acetylglucosamine deacetylase
MQQTIQKETTTTGTGLHSGAAINLALKPAPAGHGIVFVRTDLQGDNRIPCPLGQGDGYAPLHCHFQ